MEGRNMAQRVEQLEKEIHLTKHRLNNIEQEQLPRRVASMEPVVQRLEVKMDDLSERVDVGFEKINKTLATQVTLQKSMIYAFIAVVGFIKILPYLKELLK